MMRTVRVVVLALFALFASAAIADERILAFDSAIVVSADASIQVTETFRVRSEGVGIVHGLFRDFPTDYRDRRGNLVQAGFTPQSLTRDGQPEPFRAEQHGNGVRITTGSQNITLPPGEHAYVLRYRTTHQLGFFGARDELYWNVTGNWTLPIDTASATLTLPGAIAAPDLHVEAYTGIEGARGTDYTAHVDAPSHAQVRTTRGLAPHEGLTLVASFPQGAVVRPITQHLAGIAVADERIVAFDSAIVVAADASMRVTETIRVNGLGQRIRHGIYRDFPTDYRDRLGNRVHVDFDPEDLTRDGNAEAFHTEAQGNGIRVYFGAKDTMLGPGVYTYTFRYRTTRQLGFFADHDELYWNATGNGWDFTIDAASATVTLPDAIPTSDLHVEAYTGVQGSKGQDYTARADAPSHATFTATRALAPREGLTIVVEFPKGVVIEPSAAQRSGWFLRDNGGALVVGIGLLLTWLYYVTQWLRVGRDPKRGVIIAQYDAPSGLSPGALRHIERMGYDDACFAADAVDLGVRRTLDIRQDGTEYSLLRAADAAPAHLPVAEALLLDELFSAGDTLTFKQSNHVRIAAIRNAHKTQLKKSNEPTFFSRNTMLMWPAALITLAAVGLGLLAAVSGEQLAASGFLMLWLSGWTAGVVTLVSSALNSWRAAKGTPERRGAIVLSIFALPFIAGELAGLGAFAMTAGVGFALIVFAHVATHFAFFEWLKAPTPAGRKVIDQIEGLRLYLSVAERDELAAQKVPPLTPDEFQRMLPYALALGVETNWTDRFAAAVGPAAAAAAVGAMGWYHANGGVSNLANLSSGLGSSLSSAISSSSSAPGSSSGGGGGGSSGGGGGGGGGGGW